MIIISGFSCNQPCRRGFSFVEIIVAALVSVIFFTSLIYFASRTRTQTANAGNYLKALQIVQETIELIQSMPVSDNLKKNAQIFDGSLIDPSTGKSVRIPFHQFSAWQPMTKTYPESYEKSYFYRKVRVQKVESSIPGAKFLTKIAVDVYWNEGKKPAKIDTLGSEPDRMRKISMATIVFDESAIY